MAIETRRERRGKQKRDQRQRQRRSPSSSSSGIVGRLLVPALVIVAIAVGFWGMRAAGVFDPPPAPLDLNSSEFQVASGTTIGTLQPDQGTAHIPVGQPGHYNTEPPTSGEHWSSSSPAAPTPWGIKDAMLPREVTTHNLEHGGIVIAYNNLSPTEVDQLRSVVRALMNGTYRKIVLEPYPPLGDAKIALTAWRWMLKLPSVDQVQVVQFVRAHYADQNYAPEWNIQ